MNKNHFFISDPHLGHGNILKYCNRIKYLNNYEIDKLQNGIPFKVSEESVKRMDDDIINNINKVAKKNDVLWIAGDFCFCYNDYYTETKEYLSKINCQNIHIFWGNHDRPSVIRSFFSSNHNMEMIAINPDSGEYFIGAELIQKERRLSNYWIKIMISHYCMATWYDANKGVLHLYGHSHSNLEKWANESMPSRRSMDIGVDNANLILGEYRPFSLKEITNLLSNNKGHSVDHHRKK